MLYVLLAYWEKRECCKVCLPSLGPRRWHVTCLTVTLCDFGARGCAFMWRSAMLRGAWVLSRVPPIMVRPPPRANLENEPQHKQNDELEGRNTVFASNAPGSTGAACACLSGVSATRPTFTPGRRPAPTRLSAQGEPTSRQGGQRRRPLVPRCPFCTIRARPLYLVSRRRAVRRSIGARRCRCPVVVGGARAAAAGSGSGPA